MSQDLMDDFAGSVTQRVELPAKSMAKKVAKSIAGDVQAIGQGGARAARNVATQAMSRGKAPTK